MLGLDDWIARFASSGSMALVVALLLGLRHATDPDHLTAVSTLVLGDQGSGARRAGFLGLAWGLGHAATLVVFGLPVVLFRQHLPGFVLAVAEAAIGVVIIALAVRLLVRWRRGAFHSHTHTHNGLQHSHPHAHEGSKAHQGSDGHTHAHAESLGRSPLAAFGIGLIHGVGGTAAVGILVVGAASSQLRGVVALVLFALGTAISMALVSWTVGYALARGPMARRITAVVPLLALLSLGFGTWYALDSLNGLPLLLAQ